MNDYAMLLYNIQGDNDVEPQLKNNVFVIDSTAYTEVYLSWICG